MEEKKIKESVDTFIGKEKLFTHQLRNRILENALKTKPRGVPLFNKLKPILALLLIIVGSTTYFYLSYDFNVNNKSADTKKDQLVEKPIVEPVSEPIDPSHLFKELDNHGKPLPSLKYDLLRVMSTSNSELGILEAMNNSINGVTIDDAGVVLVEFKDYRSDIPNPSLQLLDSLLKTLYDTIFKYPEVTSAMFSFDGNLTTWQEWSSTGPMVRQYTFDLNTHGDSFPELETDLNNLMSYGYVFDTRNVEVLADSVNGVSINNDGTVVVEFKDFRQEFGSLTTNEKGLFLWPLSDTVFKYSEVKEVYFTFEGNFTDWYQWLEYTPEPMVRQAQDLANKYDYINNLLSNHSYYNDMYELLLDGKLIDNRGAEVFVLYLEALKNNDPNEVMKYSVHTNDDKIETLLSQYKQINFNSLTIDNIVPSEGEPVCEVHLSYKHKDGSSGKRLILIQFYDGKISIFD